MERFIHPRTERRWRQIAFVIKHGVLGWGMPVALVMFLVDSYRRDAWVGPRDFVAYLVIWGLAGMLLGWLQLDDRAERDDARRCQECGGVRRG